jgi:hypothetical protein
MIKLILFHSEGSPNDNALNLTPQKNLMIQKYKSEFDEIVVYTPFILKELGYGHLCNDYEDSGVISRNKPQKNIGFSKWKPLICRLELEKAHEDDIIMYHDIDCIKYDKYLKFQNIKKTINEIMNICKYDFFFPQEHQDKNRLEMFCKKTVLIELGENHIFNHKFNQLCVNFILLKKTKITFELLDEWLDACKNERWIDGVSYEPEDDRFVHHCPEQGILNNIVANWIRKKKNNINNKYPGVYLIDRQLNRYLPVNSHDYLQYI